MIFFCLFGLLCIFYHVSIGSALPRAPMAADTLILRFSFIGNSKKELIRSRRKEKKNYILCGGVVWQESLKWAPLRDRRDDPFSRFLPPSYIYIYMCVCNIDISIPIDAPPLYTTLETFFPPLYSGFIVQASLSKSTVPFFPLLSPTWPCSWLKQKKPDPLLACW